MKILLLLASLVTPAFAAPEKDPACADTAPLAEQLKLDRRVHERTGKDEVREVRAAQNKLLKTSSLQLQNFCQISESLGGAENAKAADKCEAHKARFERMKATHRALVNRLIEPGVAAEASFWDQLKKVQSRNKLVVGFHASSPVYNREGLVAEAKSIYPDPKNVDDKTAFGKLALQLRAAVDFNRARGKRIEDAAIHARRQYELCSGLKLDWWRALDDTTSFREPIWDTSPMNKDTSAQ